ncbi:MAG TPA: MDR family MFS transporter [Tepidisphaeraceae bacterium]|jgi:MFS family permease
MSTTTEAKAGKEKDTDVAAPVAPEQTDTAIIERRYVTAALMLVMVLASMEQTVTSTAMPTIIGDLHGLEHYSWVASIYLLACTVSMPLYGRMADAFGRKRVVLAAIVLFCGASTLAAFSQSMIQLIIFRGIQGLGAGGIMPVVLTIAGDIYTLKQRAKIQGLFSAVWGTASLAGPALGAFLVKGFGWRSVFFVNLPTGAIGLTVLAWKYHEKRHPHKIDLDLPGVAALALTSMGLLALVSRLGPDGWSWGMIALLSLVTICGVAYSLWHERRAEHPILPMELVSRRAVGPSILASCIFGAGFLCLDTYVPLYVQGGRGGDATAAASVVTPVMLTWALSGILAAPMLVRFGFRKTATLGASLIIVGFTGLLLCAHLHSSQTLLTVILAVTGFGFGPASMAYLIAAQEAVDYHQRGIVTSSIQFFRTIGGALGIGLAGALFNSLIAGQLAHLRSLGVTPAELMDAKIQSHISPAIVQQMRAMISGGLEWVFAAMLCSAAFLWIVTQWMPRRVSEHKISVAEAMEAV